MKFIKLSLLAVIMTLSACKNHDHEPTHAQDAPGKTDSIGPITLVIHGGAGTITKASMTAEKEKLYRAKLTEALNAGYSVLEEGGSSLDAVITSIGILEESPLFNAGRGAVFTNEGKNELDASIMDGSNGMAGAVAGVTTVKSPIRAALAVMQSSPHVMMAGKGADLFAAEQGLDIVDPSYFYDSARHNQLRRLQENSKNSAMLNKYPDHKFGTVGCVALDAHGNIAAGTSTGGMTDKKYGRIGDSPVIGAGTYADNQTCGVSATGHGEFFIRNVVAYDIAALMKYKQLTLQQAAEEVINQKLVEKGGSGGIIALDRQGNITMPFNTSGMYRGYIRKKNQPEVFIYKD